MARTLITGGLVITASDESHVDVLVDGGRVVGLATLTATRGRPTTSSTPPGST